MRVTYGWCRTSASLADDWLICLSHSGANRDGSAPSNKILFKHIVLKVLHKHPTVKQGPHNETKFWLFVELW
jgi:hypothetical protein